MKTSHHRVLLGAAPLLLAGSAHAAFTGMVSETKTNTFGLLVCNIYACFDNPNDHMVAVAGTPNTPMSVEIIGGTFYNNGFQTPGGAAPNSAFIPLFPSLEFDTFVTIGRKTDDAVTGTTPGFPNIDGNGTFNSFGGTNLSWFITVDDAQGAPDADGKVLIGQFTTEAVGASLAGFALIQARSDGDPFFQTATSFGHLVPAPAALAVLALAGTFGPRRRRR